MITETVNIREEETIKIKRFADQMRIELDHNVIKGSILNWSDFNDIITELEYHKAKIFMAIRVQNIPAAKEYIADSANILLALGNFFGMYECDTVDYGTGHELNKTEDFIKELPIENSSLNQTIIKSK